MGSRGSVRGVDCVRFGPPRHFSVNEPIVAGEPSWSTPSPPHPLPSPSALALSSSSWSSPSCDSLSALACSPRDSSLSLALTLPT